MEEEYFGLTSIDEATILAKCSARITRESWEKKDEYKAIVLGSEMWRSYGLYADHPYNFHEVYSGDLTNYVAEFKENFPAEWYQVKVGDKDFKPVPYVFSDDDLKATDWRGW